MKVGDRVLFYHSNTKEPGIVGIFFIFFNPLIVRPNLIIVLICRCMIADQDFSSAALAEIVREGYPDHTAFDPKSEYYDEKSTKEDPRWFMVRYPLFQLYSRQVPCVVALVRWLIS